MQNHKLFIHFGLLFVFRNLTQLGFMFAVAPQNINLMVWLLWMISNDEIKLATEVKVFFHLEYRAKTLQSGIICLWDQAGVNFWELLCCHDYQPLLNISLLSKHSVVSYNLYYYHYQLRAFRMHLQQGKRWRRSINNWRSSRPHHTPYSFAVS